jgi:xanthine dehydrogenase iron-sulfur cluster and FAD-binding subunit A
VRPAPFEYFAPRTVDEALDLLARYGGDAKVLAGGQSLVPMMNMRLVRPAVVVDVNRVAGLGGVREDGGGLRLGALVRQHALERDGRFPATAPLLAEAAPVIGHLQTRARGTIGGSVAHADPAAELPACMIALDAVLHLRSARAARACRAEDFFRGLLATALEPDELLAEIEVPGRPEPRAGHGFAEVARRHGDFALVGACAVVALDAAGVCRHARLVIFGAGDAPRLARATAALVGEPPSASRLAELGRAAADEIDARGDLHATSEYRRRVAAGLAAQVLGSAIARAAAGVRVSSRRSSPAGKRRAAPGTAEPSAPAERPTLGGQAPPAGHARHDIAVVVNGTERRARVIPRMLLADLLREDFGLTGTHLGCEHGACGACTVLVDGEPARACLVFAVQADGCRVDTVEGLAGDGPGLHPLQDAFRTRHALQCGFCTPGILMTLAAYLREHPEPSETDIREALSGNLCRCTGYQNIVLAALDAAAVLRGARGPA